LARDEKDNGSIVKSNFSDTDEKEIKQEFKDDTEREITKVWFINLSRKSLKIQKFFQIRKTFSQRDLKTS
jgi:hypothetical protein